jgi:hypothetical protein
MWKDSVVEEVRKAGKKVQNECSNDLHSFAVMLKKNTEKLKKEGWTVVGKKQVLNSRRKSPAERSSLLLKVSEAKIEYGRQ